MRVPIAAGVEVDVDSNRLTAEHYRYIESLDARLDEGEGVEVVRLPKPEIQMPSRCSQS